MALNVAQEMAVLQGLSVAQLRGRYAEVFGETTKASHKTWLSKRILWRLQAVAQGGLSERAHRRIAELANEADLRLFSPRPLRTAARKATPSRRNRAVGTPAPGTVLTRRYKGQSINVKVLADGFELAEVFYPSLSAVAKAVTGSHCNGFLFFRLGKYGVPR